MSKVQNTKFTLAHYIYYQASGYNVVLLMRVYACILIQLGEF